MSLDHTASPSLANAARAYEATHEVDTSHYRIASFVAVVGAACAALWFCGLAIVLFAAMTYG